MGADGGGCSRDPEPFRGTPAVRATLTVGLDRVRLALDPALRLGGGVWRRVRVASDEVRGRYMVAEPPAGAESDCTRA